MAEIKHVFFDLDHTIWDFERNSQEALSTLFAANEKRLSDIRFSDFMPVYRRINEDYWRLYRADKVSKEDLRINRFKESFSHFGKEFEYDFLNKFAIDYLAISPHKTNLFEGAFEVLDYLKAKYQLHIITNGFKDVQYIKLEKSGLMKYFDCIVCSEEVGVKKPNPNVFNYALNLAGAHASESVMIGDSLEADVHGALNANMHAIWFNPFDKSVTPDIVAINQLIGLKRLL